MKLSYEYKNIWYDPHNKLDVEYFESIELCNYDSKLLKNKDEYMTTMDYIKVEIDCPLEYPKIFTLKSDNGFTFDKFIQELIELYKRIYKEENKVYDEMYNKKTTSFNEYIYMGIGPHKIVTYGFDDLVLEEIYYNDGIFLPNVVVYN